MATKQTLAEFIKTLRKEQTGADGRFLGPQTGTNYQAEGLTPEQYYNLHINDQRSNGKFEGYGDNMAFGNEDIGSVNADWVKGPRNNGMLGGMLDGFGAMFSDPKVLTALAAVVGGGLLHGGIAGLMGGAGGASAAGTSAAAAPVSGTVAGATTGAALPSMGAVSGVNAGLAGAATTTLPTVTITGAAGAGAGMGAGMVPAAAVAAGGAGLLSMGGDQSMAETNRLSQMNSGDRTLAGISPGSTLAGGAGVGSSLLSKAGDFLTNPKNLLSLSGAALGALSAKDTTQTSSTNRDPWGPAQSYLKDNLATNANAQEHYRQNPFTAEQKTAYQGLLNTNANNQAGGNGLLANANNFMQSRRGVMPTMQAMPTNTQAAPIDWSQYTNIGRR